MRPASFQSSVNNARSWADELVIYLVLGTDLLYGSRLYWLFGPASQPFVLGLPAALSIYFTIVCALNGRLFIALLVVVWLSLVFFQVHIFASLAGTSMLINVGFQFISPVTLSFFYIVAQDSRIISTMQALRFYATAYAFLYFLLAISNKIGIVPAESVSALSLDDPERGIRLYIYSSAAAYAWFIAVTSIRLRVSILSLMSIFFTGGALALSESRFLIVVIVFLTSLYVLAFSRRTIQRTCLVLFTLISVIYLYGIIDSRWNPFEVFASDSSGGTRAHEFEVARVVLNMHPIFGIGIPENEALLEWTFASGFFSPSDLGVVGVWVNFGLLGFLLFIGSTWVSCSLPFHSLINDRCDTALMLTGCAMGLYGSLAPTIWYGGGTYFALALALWLTKR